MSIRAVFPCNNYDKIKLKYIINSLEYFNIPYDIIGLGKDFHYINKIYWLYEYLQKQCNTDIIIFSDAHDVFYIQNLDIIKDKFIKQKTDILWSCEKGYWHGLDKHKEIYEILGKNYDYKYLNSGTFMGYVYALRNYIGDIVCQLKNKDSDLYNHLNDNGCKCTPMSYLTGEIGEYFCDQQIYSYYYALYHEKYKIILDYNCNVFYIPVHDWDNIDNYIKFKDKKLYIKKTNDNPSIVHCPWLTKYRHIYDYIYDNIFNLIIKKKYVWQHDCNYVNGYLYFHKNKLETTWGIGTYTQISNHTYKLTWQNSNHILTFNQDFTKFKSVRESDLHISSGELLPKGFDIY